MLTGITGLQTRKVLGELENSSMPRQLHTGRHSRDSRPRVTPLRKMLQFKRGNETVCFTIKWYKLTSLCSCSLQPFNGHTQQPTVIQQYGDWYTSCWCVGCYIWYSEEGTGRGPRQPTNQWPVYSIWHYNYLCTLKSWFTSPGDCQRDICLVACAIDHLQMPNSVK